MEHKIVSSVGSRRLIIFFAGWAMDSKPFESLCRPGYDVAVVWDYRNMDFDSSWTEDYTEICIIAWSFGVYASAVATSSLNHHITLRIAINGTLYPCDANYGIPPVIFEGTLTNLSSLSLDKFYRRMCGGARSYSLFGELKPNRDIDGLKDELKSFAPKNYWSENNIPRFDLAIIGRRDAIIPPENQKKAWAFTPTVILDDAHFLDFQAVIDRYIIDKDRVSERFSTGLKSYDTASQVQNCIVDTLLQRMRDHGVFSDLEKTHRILEVGSGTGSLSRKLDNLLPESYLEMWDIAGTSCLDGPDRCFRRVDAETEISNLVSESFDMVVSASTIQWFNSPVHFIEECVRINHSGRYIGISTFVAGNISQVAEATGRSLQLLTADQWKEALSDIAEIIDLYTWEYDLEFDSAVDVFKHLKATGVNALGRSGDGEFSLTEALRRYQPEQDGRYHITYKPLIMILQKR